MTEALAGKQVEALWEGEFVMLPADCLVFCYVGALPFCFFDRIRRIGGYNGYTPRHLPKNAPDCPIKAVASFAIFAARIAFSNLPTRC